VTAIGSISWPAASVHVTPSRIRRAGIIPGSSRTSAVHWACGSARSKSSDGDQVYTHKSMGYVADVFSEDVIARLKGVNAIGHTRVFLRLMKWAL